MNHATEPAVRAQRVRHRLARVVAALVGASALATIAAGCAPSPDQSAQHGHSAPAQVPHRSLHILLTNDDGWRGPGGSDTPLIAGLRAKLLRAGNQVTVVAPASDESGQGTGISRGPMVLTQVDPGVFTVTGTPRDALGTGLDVVLAGHSPDLVISGLNPGGNYSIAEDSSGTLAAATGAAERGIPAVAVSLGTLEPSPPPGLIAAAQDYTTRLIGVLGDHPRLPAGMVLNVNYPPVVRQRGTRLTTVDPNSYLRFAYERTGATSGDPAQNCPPVSVGACTGTVVLRLQPSPGHPSPGSDWSAINEGYVSIAPIPVASTTDQHVEPELHYLTDLPAG
jgi:5'/3'-nucleotidase SurE